MEGTSPPLAPEAVRHRADATAAHLSAIGFTAKSFGQPPQNRCLDREVVSFCFRIQETNLKTWLTLEGEQKIKS